MGCPQRVPNRLGMPETCFDRGYDDPRFDRSQIERACERHVRPVNHDSLVENTIEMIDAIGVHVGACTSVEKQLVVFSERRLGRDR